MRKNVWKAMIAALCLAMTISFAACGSSTANGFDDPSSTSSSSSSSAPAGEESTDDGDDDDDKTPDPDPQPETGKVSWTKNY